jgi:hypothetical protein
VQWDGAPADATVVEAADLYPARKMGGSQTDTVVGVNPVTAVLPNVTPLRCQTAGQGKGGVGEWIQESPSL